MAARLVPSAVAGLLAPLLAAVPLTIPVADAPSPAALERPNIVLVLMDDASLDLVPTMLGAQRMARLGAAYTSAFVVDSLCCVSRSVILTGQYPHQTGVLTNVVNDPGQPVGGWTAYLRYGNGDRAINHRLHRAGYTTGFVGKFLNEYRPPGGRAAGVPPGWSEFSVLFDTAYDEWDFDWGWSAGGSRLVRRHYGAPPASASTALKDQAYAGLFIQRRVLDFISRHRRDAAPYFLEIATFAPHSKTPLRTFYQPSPVFPAMFRDRVSASQPTGNCGALACTELTVDDLAGFADPRADNRPRRADGSPAPSWQTAPTIKARAARAFLRDRARMVQAIDRMLRRVLDAVDDNTYVVFTSDNGLHLGQWGLGVGKGTAYDTDLHVPLYVVGPGVTPGPRDGMVTNLDLAPTLEQLAGLGVAPFRSGVSFAPSLQDPEASRRRFVFVEHTWSGQSARDPDAGDDELVTIPSYVAVRSADGLLIRYDYDRRVGHASYAWELYDYRRAGEATNVFADPDAHVLQRTLRARLTAFLGCRHVTRNEPVPARCRSITR